MTNAWLSAHNFERSYRLVSAINTISIHEKLKGSGVNDESRFDEVKDAKSCLLDFLRSLNDIVHDAERNPERLVEGIDPQDGRPCAALPERSKATTTNFSTRHGVSGRVVRPRGGRRSCGYGKAPKVSS